MRIPYPCKPQAVAAKSPGRYAFSMPHYLPELNGDGRPVVSATDGHMLVVLPVPLDDGDGFNGRTVPLPADVLKTACKKAEPRIKLHDVDPDMKLEVGPLTVTTDAGGEYPDVGAVSRDCNPSNPPKGVRVRLNARKLARLADALGTHDVEIVLPEPRKWNGSVQVSDAILVLPGADAPAPDAFGLLMPIAR